MSTLVIGPGPGFPFLHEARAITRALELDPARTAFVEHRATSVAASVDDVDAAARELAARTGAPVTALGISLGASFAVLAAARDPRPFRAIVGLGIDVDIPAADVAARAFAHGDPRVAPSVRDAKAFQRRAKVLSDLDGIQVGARWGATVRRTFFALLRTRGPIGAIRALRAMNRVQDALLPELATWTLHDVRSFAVPIALVHGARDAVSPPALAKAWLDALDAPSMTWRLVDGIAHLPHVEAPAIVREAIAAYSSDAKAA